jgi:hypothetical protein
MQAALVALVEVELEDDLALLLRTVALTQAPAVVAPVTQMQLEQTLAAQA